MEPLRVHIAELVIADDPASADVASADIVTERATAVGHAVVGRVVVKDAELAIREQLQTWIAQPDVDVVIVTGAAESTTAAAALRPLVTQPIAGFTDLFRWLAFQEIGASAMQSNAEAAQCGTTFVFVLPAVLGAVRAAMDKLINPQLDPATTPKNLVMQMPRLQPLVDAARALADKSVPQAVDAAKTEAVPQAIGPEKTEGGIGMPARLPARKSPTGQHVLRKDPAPDVTRQVDRAQLERDLKASTMNDAPTKPSIDIRSLIPRVPPGADDDGTLDVGDDTDITMAAPQPFARVKLAKQPAPASKPAATPIPSIKTRTTDEITDELPPVRTETIVTKAAPPSPRPRPDTDVVPPPAPVSGTSSSGPASRPGRPSESGPAAQSGATARPKRPSESVPSVPSVVKASARSGPGTSGPRRTPPALTPPAGNTTIYPKSKRPAATDLDVVSIEELAARAELDGPTEQDDEAVIVGRKPADDRDEAATVARRPGAADEARTVVRKPGGDEAVTHRAGAEPPTVVRRPGAADEAATTRKPDHEPATTRKADAPTSDSAPTHKADAPTSDSGPTRKADAVRVDDAPKRRPPTEPPPPPGARAKRPPTAPPPPPKPIRPDTTEVVDDELVGASAIVAVATGAVPARSKARTPTEPPPPRESSDDLPRGKFEYPVKRSSAGRIAIWGALAVLAAAAGIAFVKFFVVDKQQPKIATAPGDAAQVAVVTPDAPAVAVAPDGAVTPAAEVTPDAAPEIDIDVSGGSGSNASTSGSNGGRPDDGHGTRPNGGHATTASGGHSTTNGGHTTASGGHATTASGGHSTASGGHTTSPGGGQTGGTSGGQTGGTSGGQAGGHSSDAGTAAPPSDPGCDEVSCVMEKYARACCARYKPSDSGFKPGAGGVPEELDRTMVRAGIEKVKPRVIACGEKTATKGTVKISVSVGPEGDVKEASVVETPSPDLGSCVASALRAARFVRTAKGGSFTYPFVF